MSNIRIGHMTLGIYQTNCYFVYRENSDKVLVFDPADHGEKIEAALGQHGLHTAAILLTHGHFDHIGGCAELKAAAEEIHRFTQNTVIVTLGADGCYYYDGEKEETIPGVPAEQLDTIGAGDSHIGAVIAGLQCGKTIEEAIATANRVSAKVVETEGALLSDEAFASLDLL